MSFCNCKKYDDLMMGDAIRKRARVTGKIIRSLDEVASYSNGRFGLYQCRVCQQLWQLSYDWSLGNKAYAFKVPPISVADWLEQPYVSPDELQGSVGYLGHYLENATFEETERMCKSPGCPEHTTKFSVFCALHHIQSLGFKTGAQDQYRWFPPYDPRNFELTMDDLKAHPAYKTYGK